MDSVGVCILGLRCSWWHLRQANDVVSFQWSIFSKSQDYKSFLRVMVNPNIPIYLGLNVCGGGKLKTHAYAHTRTHTQTGHYCNPRCTCTPKINNQCKMCWNKALTFGVGLIQLRFRTIVFPQYVQKYFQSKCYNISVKLHKCYLV